MCLFGSTTLYLEAWYDMSRSSVRDAVQACAFVYLEKQDDIFNAIATKYEGRAAELRVDKVDKFPLRVGVPGFGFPVRLPDCPIAHGPVAVGLVAI